MKRKLKKSVKNMLQVFLIAILIVLCLFFLKSRVTYTSYESEVEGKVASPIANWIISIDGKTITEEEEVAGIKIDDISWYNDYARGNKVAPGSTGEMTISIDPSGTDVAIYYELEVIDKTVDDTKFLKVTNIYFDNNELTKIDVNKYMGVLSLSDIRNGVKPQMKFDVIWESTEDIVYDREAVSDLDGFLVVNFSARQYNGETLPAAYTE